MTMGVSTNCLQLLFVLEYQTLNHNSYVFAHRTIYTERKQMLDKH
jgi:hypothetical protein